MDAVSTKLTQKGFTAATREAVIDRFATEARAAVKALLGQNGAGVAATTEAGNGTGTSKGAPRRQMSTLTGVGQGGTARPGAASGGDPYKGLAANVAGGLQALD